MTKQAVIIYGQPGAGKDTQAELLARKFNLLRFSTGEYLRRFLHDPQYKNNKKIQKERELNDKGILNSPDFALKIVKAETKRIAEADYGIVYSGSPRTLFEAFGDGKTEGLLKFLGRLYGKKNIFIIKLDVSEKTSIYRNRKRLICSVCATPILAIAKSSQCSFCGGKPKRRIDDNPKIIHTRLKEYRERTFPILSKAKRAGYFVAEIDGTPAPYQIHLKIVKRLGLNR